MVRAEPQRGARFLILAAALIAIAPMSLDFYLPSFPAIAEDLNVPVSSVQLTFSAALLGMALGQLVYGPLMDRFGRKPPLLIGLGIFIVASIGCALATSLELFLVLRVVQALGGCAGMVASRAMTRDLYEGSDLAKAMSVIFLIFGIAPVLSPVLGTVVLAYTSWRGLFVVLVAYGVILLIATALAPETLAAKRRTAHGFVAAVKAYRPVVTNPVVVMSAIIQALTGAALFAFVASSPAVFLDYDGVSSTAFLAIFGGVSLFLFAMSQLNLRLLSRWSPRQIMTVVVSIQFVAGLALSVATIRSWPLGVFIGLLMIAVSGVGFMMPNSTATALEPCPQSAGLAAALVGCTGLLGGAIWAAALASASTPPPTSMALGIAVATGVCVPLAIWLQRHRPPVDAKGE